MEELILTLSVIMVYNVSVGAVGGVGLTGDREPWALLLHRERLLSLNTAAADKADSEVEDQTGAIETCQTSLQCI